MTLKKLHIIIPVVTIVFWTVFILFLFSFQVRIMRNYTRNLALNEAVSTFNSDWKFRKWASSHGGLYIPVSDKLKPNPNLKDIDEQNIQTPSGKNLTLMNPAWAIRSLNEYETQVKRAKTHITSLNLIRPENAPDSWEQAALLSFEEGTAKVVEPAELEGVPYLRYMEPLHIEKGCLKCHGYQGYEVGDIRGGISVSVSYAPYLEIEMNEIRKTGYILGLIYFSVLIFILFGIKLLGKRNLIIEQTRKQLIETNKALEQEVQVSNSFNGELKREIEEHATAEKEKEHLQAQLNYKNKMDGLGQLAGGIAHDFNNVLHSISSSAELLKMNRKGLQGGELKYVDMILKSSSKASRLTEKLLTYSRRRKNTFHPVNMHNLIDDSLSILENSINKKIRLTLNKNAEHSTVSGDESGLENVIINLIINGSQAITGSGEIRVSTRNIEYKEPFTDFFALNVKAGMYCILEVCDTGCGITEEDLHKIFEPFYTTKKAGEGTGLGLTTVYTIAQTHNGSLEISSSPGRGTALRISLPVIEDYEEKSRETDSPAVTGTGRVLVVDDEEMNRELVAELLDSLGYESILAENGADALERYRSSPEDIDIVLLDMIMPVMDGRETFFKLREIDPDCKVVLSSGYAKDKSIDELMDHNLNGFISKPYRVSELSNILSSVIQK